MARREKGEGSLYQSKDKTWVYQYMMDGKRKTKRFQKKADASAYIESLHAAAAAERETGRPAQNTVLTVGEWMDRWLEKYARPSVKLSTYCSYELYVRSHIKPQIGGLYMNTLTEEELQDFFNERAAKGNQKGAGGLAPKTLTNMRNMMHLAFSQAVKNKLLRENLVESVRLPKVEKYEMRVLDREEQRRLILAAKMAPEPAAFGVIFDLFTGLRIGELCGLRWENVDMANRMIKVREIRNRLPNHDDTVRASTSVHTVQTTKTDNSRRSVYIMDSLYQDLKSYQEIQRSIQAQDPLYNREGYVFCQENGQPYEPRTYQDLFKRCVRRAGIADANFHSLRHTFATRCMEQGMDVVTLARLLGHASPAITLDKYGHALSDHQRASVEKLGTLYQSTPIPYATPQQEQKRVETPAVGFEMRMQF